MRFIHYVGILGFALCLCSGCKKAPPPPQPQAKVEPEKKPEPPKVEVKKEEKKPDLKAPEKYKGLVYNIHMQARRPEILNDLKEIGTFYQIDASSGAAPKTWAAFKPSLRTAGRLVQKIEQDKLYVINLNGRKLLPTEILAYEKEASSPAGFVIVRASGQVEEPVSFEQMVKELGLK
jgi:hypothetical protein